MQQSVHATLFRAKQFVLRGVNQITRPHCPSSYLINAAPVPTALAMVALATQGQSRTDSILRGAHYLEQVQLEDGGWGNTPVGPSNPLASGICSRGLQCQQPDADLKELIYDSACLVAKTWTQDFDRLAPEWLPKQNSPVLKLLEAIAGRSLVPTLESITLKDIRGFAHFMPPYGRPTMLGATLIKEFYQKGWSEEIEQSCYNLLDWISPDGSWCEDIVVTSLAVMALHITGFQPKQEKACDWLCSIQYESGGWPSFNQLTNWITGWAAHILGRQEPAIFNTTTPYLSKAVYSDGSLGTTPPYSHPDLDDTAIGLMGLASDPSVNSLRLAKTRQVLVNLQNWDGSWGTFPSFKGLPPRCECAFPVYIKSEDITVHILQALVKTGMALDDSHVLKGIHWLLKHQHKNGAWNSTWFLGRTYATAQVLDLLLDVSPRSPEAAKGIRYLLDSQTKGHWDRGSAGETGLALYALLKAGLNPRHKAITDGLGYLSSLQLDDGSFRPFYCGFYASGLYYEEPLSEALAAVRALQSFAKKND